MSRFNFSSFIALRYLWSKRSEAFITIITVVAILGVAIGVMVLNIVMSIMSGFEHELQTSVVGSSHIQVSKANSKIDGWRNVLDTIRKVKDVEQVSAYSQHQALITYKNRSFGVLMRGLAEDTKDWQNLESQNEELKKRLSKQTFDSTEAELPGIILGSSLGRNLGLDIGDPISILSAQMGSSPFGLMPKYKRFLITGFYHSGSAGVDDAMVYVALEQAQAFFRLSDTVNYITASVKYPDRSADIARQIETSLGKGFVALDWTQQHQELWEAMKLEKRVYFIVLLLLIVMASFSIITTLVMIVMEKRKDIAVLRTLGASGKSIAKIFMLQGTVIGVIGTVSGTILGYVGCVILRSYGFPLPANVFPTDVVPVQMSSMSFTIVAVFSMLICYLATIYPARRASRLKPSIVLRYD